MMNHKDPDKVKQGKQNRARGRRFEAKTRLDLESKGFICARWTNNVDLITKEIVPAKSNRFCSRTTGFPDFSAVILTPDQIDNTTRYFVIGIEAKVGKYLDKEEKEKVKILLEKKAFSGIWIATPGKKRGTVEYIDAKKVIGD